MHLLKYTETTQNKFSFEKASFFDLDILSSAKVCVLMDYVFYLRLSYKNMLKSTLKVLFSNQNGPLSSTFLTPTATFKVEIVIFFVITLKYSNC